MTHDELLEAIDFLTLDGLHAWFQPALRAVVELHKPIQDKKLWCRGCRIEDDDWYSAEYPCETIQAIEKELG